MTPPTLSLSGRKLFDLDMKQFYLEEIKWYYGFMKRNPKFTTQVIEILDNYKKLYEAK
jgi:hypothetical protein